MKYIIVFTLIIFSVLGAIYYQETWSCRNQLAYDIGSFDNGFGITRDRFVSAIKEAETVWERDLGQDLFDYRPGSKFKINLIFDDRQKITLEGAESKEEIEESRSYYNSLLARYKDQEAAYKQDLAQYEIRVDAFEQRLSSYNSRVAGLNKKGGATPKEYQELEQERRNLEDIKSELDAERLRLNAQASKLNSLGDAVNDLAQKLNIEVDIHNQVFGEAREFDQGEYTGNKINIYQFDSLSSLKLVLAHELGHALGLNHVENPKSIMYYLMDQQNLNNTALTREDIAAFRAHCDFHIPKLQEIFQ